PGLLAGGVCFILPAALLVAALAWAYVRFGALPAVVGVLYGIKPVVIAVVAQALWGMARTAVKTRGLALLGAAAVAATLLGADQLAVLVGAGVVSALVWRFGAGRQSPGSGMALAAVPAAAAPLASAVAVPFGL